MFCLRRHASLLLLIPLLLLPLQAQSPEAGIVGVVRDTSGATVPSAGLQVRNMDTNGLRQLASDNEGRFAVPNLEPGLYEVTVEKTGFEKLRESGIELQVNQTVRLELTLKVGSVSESVEVTAEAPLVNTENATKGAVMVSQEISELPLNGRNFQDLAFLVPGVNQSGAGDTGSPFAIGGARNDNTNYIIDGVSARRPEYGQTELSPNLDAIQEFKVATSNYSAEYGMISGGVISVALKSGTNQLHGALFEFFRNDLLDARNFFSATKPELRQNQFGGLLSGPVWLPKIYNGHNKTFFLFSWESQRVVAGNTNVTLVPTALQRHGDFSRTLEANGKPAAITNPFSKGVFPGAVIPASLISPISQKILPYWPTPNQFGQTNNYVAQVNGHTQFDNFLTKIDERISDKDSISLRWEHNAAPGIIPFDGSPLGTYGSQWTYYTTQIIGLSWVHLFTPTLINEARAGLYRNVGLEVPLDIGTDNAAKWGISGISSSNPFLLGTPDITVTGYALVGDNNGRPWVVASNDYSYYDTLTWIHGAHQVKFGGNLLRTQHFQPYYSNVRGSFTFNGNWTGDSLADFMLGLLNNATRETQPPENYIFSTSYGLFAQDDYKITSRLTLNLGLRWDVNAPMYDKFGRWAGFIPQFGKIVVANDSAVPNFNQLIAATGYANIVTLANNVGVPQSLVYGQYHNMAPRFGFAWRPFGGTRTVLRGGYGIFWGVSQNNPLMTALGTNYPFSVSQTVNRVASNPSAINLADPFATASTAAALSVSGVQLNAPTPYLQSWNLTAEHQLGSSMLLEIGYNASKGTHLGLTSDLNRPFYSQQFELPNGNFVRPYPQYNNVINYTDFVGNSIYNAGVVTLRRRFAHGFFFNLNYTYSKSIDIGSTFTGGGNGGPHQVEDPRNLALERGRSNFDEGHAFTMSYSWAMPWRPSVPMGWMLRGWQLAGSGQAHTGPPFTPALSNVNLALGGSIRPDRLSKGAVPNPSVQQWFNVAAFPPVPSGQFRLGNSGRNILDGPGLMSLNFSLLRNIRVREHGSLQFRWEVFNATNHANFGLPIATMNTVTAGTITSTTAPRLIQLALRYQF